MEAIAQRSQSSGQPQTRATWSPGGGPEHPSLVVDVLGQSNAFGMGVPVDLASVDQAYPRVHQRGMCGRPRAQQS